MRRSNAVPLATKSEAVALSPPATPPPGLPRPSGKLQLLFSDDLRERLLAPMALGDGRRNYRPRLQNPRIVVAVGILAPPLVDDRFFAALAPEMARWPVPEGV